jgi:hypothetical protein
MTKEDKAAYKAAWYAANADRLNMTPEEWAQCIGKLFV